MNIKHAMALLFSTLLLAAWLGTMAIYTGGSFEADGHGFSIRAEGSAK